MPHFKTIQSDWGRLLLVRPAADEVFDSIKFHGANEKWRQLLLWPICSSGPAEKPNEPDPSKQTDQLIYRISGLINLAEARKLSRFKIEHDLRIAAALCQRLIYLEEQVPATFLTLDAELIFFPCDADGEPLWQEPLCLYLPIRPAQNSKGIPERSEGKGREDKYENGLLAEVSEPLIRLARLDDRLDEEITDALLIHSWETPAVFWETIQTALKKLDKQDLAAAAGHDAPMVDKKDDPGGIKTVLKKSKGGSKKKGRREKQVQDSLPRPRPPLKKRQVSFILLAQLPILIAGLKLAEKQVDNPLSLVGLGLLLSTFFILDLLLLLHRKSPLRSGSVDNGQEVETTAPALSPESDLQHALKAAENRDLQGEHQNQVAGRPKALLMPQDLLYREAGSDDVKAGFCFRPARLVDLYFAIGQDAAAVDLCLPTEEIAPIQAEIIFNGETYLLRCGRTEPYSGTKKPDLYQETRLNGIVLEAFSDRQLQDRDLISFGRYLYRFVLE